MASQFALLRSDTQRGGRGPQVRLRGTRQQAAQLSVHRLEQAKSQSPPRDDRLGCDPDHHGALCRRALVPESRAGLSLVGNGIRLTGDPARLWNFDRPYRWKRVLGRLRSGHNAPASAGAALANARHAG